MREPRHVGLETPPSPQSAVEVVNSGGKGQIVLACEHASRNVPDEFDNLGLDAPALESHIAWDPGARALGLRLSELLDAPFVASRISRLVYDCNRPLQVEDAIPERSETFDVPGNVDLSTEQREKRWRLCHEPFHDALSDQLNRSGRGSALVTLHSFTPVYFGRRRDVEIGILLDEDSRLADEMLSAARTHTSFDVRRNEPYSAADGVTHTLKIHGIENNLPNVMLEIRNDLLATDVQVEEVARSLSSWLSVSLSKLMPRMELVQ